MIIFVCFFVEILREGVIDCWEIEVVKCLIGGLLVLSYFLFVLVYLYYFLLSKLYVVEMFGSVIVFVVVVRGMLVFLKGGFVL